MKKDFAKSAKNVTKMDTNRPLTSTNNLQTTSMQFRTEDDIFPGKPPYIDPFEDDDNEDGAIDFDDSEQRK